MCSKCPRVPNFNPFRPAAYHFGVKCCIVTVKYTEQPPSQEDRSTSYMCDYNVTMFQMSIRSALWLDISKISAVLFSHSKMLNFQSCLKKSNKMSKILRRNTLEK